MRLGEEAVRFFDRAHVPSTPDERLIAKIFPLMANSLILICSGGAAVYRALRHGRMWELRKDSVASPINLDECRGYIASVEYILTTVDDSLVNRLIQNVERNPLVREVIHEVRRLGASVTYAQLELVKLTEADVREAGDNDRLILLEATPMQQAKPLTVSTVRLGFRISGSSQDPALAKISNLVNELRQRGNKLVNYMQVEPGGSTATLWIKFVVDAPQLLPPDAGDAVDKTELQRLLRELRRTLSDLLHE